VTSTSASNFICNTNTPASDTVSVAAGSIVGFKLDNSVYHIGPAAMYLGKVPSGSTAATWNGQGTSWFKIAEWGATYNGQMSFSDMNAGQLTATLPGSVPAGDVSHRFFLTFIWESMSDTHIVPPPHRANRSSRPRFPAMVHLVRTDYRHWWRLRQPDQGLHAAVRR
jgi:hypothetical protein